MSDVAIQDQLKGNLCFGCGADNPDGLQIKSYWDGESALCTYTPAPFHCAGPRNVLNGGIIATLIDCHCICTALADAYRREGRDIGSDPILWYATGNLTVDYLRPAPIAGPVTLRARAASVTDRKSHVECVMSYDGKETARGSVVAVRVPFNWHGMA